MMNNHLLQEMKLAGVVPAEPLEFLNSGDLQRYQVANDKQGTKNGWLVSYCNTDAPTVHVFGSWKKGTSHTIIEGRGSKITNDTRRLIKQAQHQAQLQKEQEQQEVAEKCTEIWELLSSAEQHPYLTAKNIHPHIARLCSDSLVIPLMDLNMNITSLQFISPNGSKTFRKGGKIKGSFCPLGCSTLTSAKTWIICEGFATGATIHEATGLPVLVAFNANNLKSVATSLRMKSKTVQIIIAADNDRFTNIGNVGVKKAEDAARDASAFVIIPQFNTNKGTDFNDLAQQKGIKIISNIFMEVTA